MEILSTDEAPDLVTNLEVMNILASQAPRSRKRKSKKDIPHAEWIQYHVQDYLNKTPCAKIQRQDEIPALITRLKQDFGLTDAETLQILNFMPQESVEIHLIIEDLPSRLTKERQEELLTLIGTYIKDNDKTKDSKLLANDDEEEIVGEIPDDPPPDNHAMENGDAGVATMLDKNGGHNIKSEPS